MPDWVAWLIWAGVICFWIGAFFLLLAYANDFRKQ